MISYIDIILVIILALAGWRGWKNGFVMELFSLLSIFVGIYAGIRLSDWFTDMMRDRMDVNASYMPLLSFVCVMIIVIIGLWFLAKLITKTVKAGGAEKWNQIGGVVFALAKTVLSLSVLFLVFHSFDSKAGIIPEEQKKKSYLYDPIYHFSLVVLPSIKESELYLLIRDQIREEALDIQEGKEKE